MTESLNAQWQQWHQQQHATSGCNGPLKPKSRNATRNVCAHKQLLQTLFIMLVHVLTRPGTCDVDPWLQG